MFIFQFCHLALQTASKSLMEAITDVYETQWTGADTLVAQTLQIDALWQDFSHKLGDQVLIPLNTYTAQFPEMKVSRMSNQITNFSETHSNFLPTHLEKDRKT